MPIGKTRSIFGMRSQNAVELERWRWKLSLQLNAISRCERALKPYQSSPASYTWKAMLALTGILLQAFSYRYPFVTASLQPDSTSLQASIPPSEIQPFLAAYGADIWIREGATLAVLYIY